MPTTFKTISEETLFGLQTGGTFGNAYPAGADGAKFGIDATTHADFVTPVAKFKFYDATGSDTDRPTIYIRMPGTFNSTLLQGWGESAGIFGKVRQGDQTLFDLLGQLGGGALTGLQSQILKGITGAAGFAASAGQSGRAQIEFNQRKLVNNFQQLIYQGPQFRRYQLPFNMKPVSETEAENMIKIIQCFRVASSPQALNDLLAGSQVVDPDALENTGNAVSIAQQDDKNASAAEKQSAQEEIIRAVGEELARQLERQVDVLAFSYPDMCQFQILLYKGDDLELLFESDVCMIESVSVDYGAQNKMTFFDKGASGKYYPTDVNLSIALREAILPTASYISNEHEHTTRTIF